MKRVWKLLLGLGVAGVFVASCGSSTYRPAVEPQVYLGDLSSVSSTLTIGLIVTSDQGAEGFQDYPLAAGAQIAAFRLTGKHHLVRLVVQDDHGTLAGSAAAVKVLLDHHVSGIVYASNGPHVIGGLQEATAAHTPVLLPYQTSPSGLPRGSWITGPDNGQVSAAIAKYISPSSGHGFVVISESGVGQPTVNAPGSSATVSITSTEPAAEISTAVTTAIKSLNDPNPGPAIVLASSEIAAEVTTALESQNVSTIILGPDALTPNFGDQLSTTVQNSANAGSASTQATFLSAGEDVYDAQTTNGVTAFRSSLRLLAYSLLANSTLQPSICFDDEGSTTADTRSQDAVIALAKAAQVAHSTTASKMDSVLSDGLIVSGEDGLAGPILNFHSQTALGSKDVTMLEATTEPDDARRGLGDPCAGGRTATPGFQLPSLQWFGISSPPSF